MVNISHIIIARAGNTTVWPFYPISSDSSSSVTRECEQHKAAEGKAGVAEGYTYNLHPLCHYFFLQTSDRCDLLTFAI